MLTKIFSINKIKSLLVLMLLTAMLFQLSDTAFAGNAGDYSVEQLSTLNANDKFAYESYLNQYEQAMAEGKADRWRLRTESFLAESHDFAQHHPHLIDFWMVRAKAAQLIYDPVFGAEAALVLQANQAANPEQSELTALLSQLKETGWLKPMDPSVLNQQVTLKVAAYSDIPRTEEIMVLKAEAGGAKAKGGLGAAYLDGHMVKKNEQKAFYWTQLAAEQGDSLAQHNLGYMYMNGKYVHKDLKKAVFWFQKAADQGNSYAQNKLGYLYAHGKALEKDPAKAIEEFQKGAEQGNVIAQYNLADTYYYGRGVPKDYSKAFHWYKLAAQQGDALAQLNLGYLYEHGHGTAKDYESALYWYRQAAAQGNSTAQSNIELLMRWYRN